MKPNFALNLSHDGIALLHRKGSEWYLIDQVQLDDDAFTEKMGFLRQTAASLEHGGITTQLIIPNSQILYTTADAPGPDDEARKAQIRQSLDGLTPYEVDQLVFDWSLVGETVHVAAIARETLEEAEAFANEHGFNPLSFVAIPDGTQFDGAPFFGPSKTAETLLEPGQSVERDQAIIVVAGPVDGQPEDNTEDLDEIPVINSDADEATGEIEPVTEHPVLELGQEHLQESDIEKTGTDDDSRTDVATASDSTSTEEPDETAANSDTESAPEPDKGSPTDDTPNTAPDSSAGVISAAIPEPDENSQGAETPAFTSRRDAETEMGSDEALGRLKELETRMDILPEGRTVLAPRLAGVKRQKDDPELPKETKSEDQSPKTPAVAPPAEMPASLAKAVADKDQDLTVFGARKEAAPNKRRQLPLGLALLLILLVAMAAVAVWSSLFLDDVATLWRGGADQEQSTAVTPSTPGAETTGSAPTADPVGDALAMLTEPTISYSSAPEPAAVSEPELPAEPDTGADRIPAAPAALSAPDSVRQSPDAPAEIAGDENPETGNTTLPQQAALSDPASEPAPMQVAPVPNTPALTPDAARESYAETGIWQLSPPAPRQPGIESLDDLYLTSIDPDIASSDAFALPLMSGVASDPPPAPLPSPTSHDTTFVLDENGLVIPTPEGTMNPDGILVFAGPPPIKPRERGNRTPLVVVEPDQRLAAFRPAPRPRNLVESNDTANLGGISRSRLAAIRPTHRPAAPKAEQERDETPTEQAVVLSSLPKHRPKNFARTVARARASAPSESATVATAVPRNQTIAPAAPTRASVARLATTKNAINLRRTSLIGVYGSSSNRRALVRLPSGRYLKVKVGQRMDGGKVAAIGESELRYVKGGRTIILRMPKS